MWKRLSITLLVKVHCSICLLLWQKLDSFFSYCDSSVSSSGWIIRFGGKFHNMHTHTWGHVGQLAFHKALFSCVAKSQIDSQDTQLEIAAWCNYHKRKLVCGFFNGLKTEQLTSMLTPHIKATLCASSYSQIGKIILGFGENNDQCRRCSVMTRTFMTYFLKFPASLHSMRLIEPCQMLHISAAHCTLQREFCPIGWIMS